jgi:hypothetical protein
MSSRQIGDAIVKMQGTCNIGEHLAILMFIFIQSIQISRSMIPTPVSSCVYPSINVHEKLLMEHERRKQGKICRSQNN